MSPKRKPESVLELAVARGGFIKARRALLFGVAWLIAEGKNGEPPATVDVYADFWNQSRAQSFREQKAFRECFPEFDTPSDLARAVGIKASTIKQGDFMTLGLAGLPS